MVAISFAANAGVNYQQQQKLKHAQHAFKVSVTRVHSLFAAKLGIQSKHNKGIRVADLAVVATVAKSRPTNMQVAPEATDPIAAMQPVDSSLDSIEASRTTTQ